MSFFDNRFPAKVDNLRNTIQQWSGSDTFENFQKYQPNPYKIDDITYKLNEYAFRCDSFIESKYRMIFLGCSICEGIGLPLEETFSYKIHKEIQSRIGHDIPYWNLGIGGCGLDSIVRCYYHFYEKLAPQVIVALFPTYRLEYLKITWKSAIPNHDSENIFLKNPYLTDPNVMIYNYEKNLTMLDLLLEKHNPLLIWDTWDRDSFKNVNLSRLNNFKNYLEYWEKLKNKRETHLPFARDGMHFGRKYHQEFSDFILNNYGDTICDRLVNGAS